MWANDYIKLHLQSQIIFFCFLDVFNELQIIETFFISLLNGVQSFMYTLEFWFSMSDFLLLL